MVDSVDDLKSSCSVRGICEQHTSHVTFSRTMTRTCVAQVVSLACAHHIPCVISMRFCCVCVCLSLFDFSTFLSLLSIFSLIVLSFLLAINFIFHDVADKSPVMKTLFDDYTIGMALSSPLFTQEREYAASRRQAYHSLDEGLPSSQSSSLCHRTGRPVVEQFDS